MHEGISLLDRPSIVSAHVAMPRRLADFDCLSEALDYAAQSNSGMHFHDARGHCLHALSYQDIADRAKQMASRLLGLNLKRNDRVGIVAAMDPDFVCMFFACQYAGLLAVPLPVISGLGGRQGYETQLNRVLTASQVRVAVGPQDSLDSLKEAARGLEMRLLGTFDDLMALPPSEKPLEPLGKNELSHIQFSSGSTQHPKGVLIAQKALMTNARAIAVEGLELREDDRVASWLPFYHDMGLIGHMIAPVASQMHVDYLLTDEFAKRPLQWVRLIAEKGSTISFSPTFGYDICADRMHGNRLDIDLSHWRVAGVGGEMVKPETLEKFVRAFAPSGFNAEALMPCYGMAEATLAVSFTMVNTGMQVDVIGKEDLQRHRAEPVVNGEEGRAFASCGRSIGNTEIEIRGEQGESLPDRHIGFVHLRGESLMEGYDSKSDSSPYDLHADGWLNTGDLGYMVGEELFLTGRAKDMMIVNGRNIWPQDLEWSVEQNVSSVRRRDTAAFAVEDAQGNESPVVLVQCRARHKEEREKLRKEVQSILMRNHGVLCEVVLIAPRSLPYTTSGKLSRARAKQAYLAGEYAGQAIEQAA